MRHTFATSTTTTTTTSAAHLMAHWMFLPFQRPPTGLVSLLLLLLLLFLHPVIAVIVIHHILLLLLLLLLLLMLPVKVRVQRIFSGSFGIPDGQNRKKKKRDE